MWFHLSYCLAGASPLPLDVEYLFLVGSNILLSMVVQQRVVILEFSQEKMSAHPSPPSSSTTLIKLLFAGALSPSFLSDLTFSAVLPCAARVGHQAPGTAGRRSQQGGGLEAQEGRGWATGAAERPSKDGRGPAIYVMVYYYFQPLSVLFHWSFTLSSCHCHVDLTTAAL